MKLNIKKATQIKLAIIALSFLTGLLALCYGLKQVALWTNYHEFVFPDKLIVWELKVNKLFEIKERETQKPIVVVQYQNEEELNQIVRASGNVPIAEKVMKAFGPVYGPTAIAIIKGESGMNCSAWNANTNDTIDIGLVQANSIHFNDEFTINDALDCDKAIAWMEQKARRDAQASGIDAKYDFRAWVYYNNAIASK